MKSYIFDGKVNECIVDILIIICIGNRICLLGFLLQLTKRGVPHQGIQIEANATALSLKLVQLPPPPDISTSSLGWTALMKRLLSVSIRSITRGNGHFWAVEFVMYGTPVASSNIHSREQGSECDVERRVVAIEGLRIRLGFVA